MRALRSIVLVALLLLLIFVGLRRRESASVLTPGAQPAPTSVSNAPVPAASIADLTMARSEILGRLAYAQAWDGPMPPALAAFREWTQRYRAATPAARRALEAEGVELAKDRRAVMLKLITTDPQRALAVTVPAVVRQVLSSTVLAELESRVAGRGDFSLLVATYDPGVEHGATLRRVAMVDGVSYTAYPYGRREPQLTKEGASLHGVALDGQFALHESPLRVLEPGEFLASAVAAQCPVSGLAVAPLATKAAVNLGTIMVVAAEGRTWEFCGGEGMVEALETKLMAVEDVPGPRLRARSVGAAVENAPSVAADAGSSHTLGAQKTLLIRVDFSDVPGDPLAGVNVQDFMDNSVSSLLDTMSYGKTSLVTTIATNIYRMPQPGSSYAASDTSASQLHSDARTAASADYTLTNFDRIHVVFPNLGASRFAGSKITFAGEGSISGTNVWTNGPTAFNVMSVTHEYGHTYGLLHANLWKVTDGNPLSDSGSSLEYGDPFDDMGTPSVTGVTRDGRHHYSPWAKNHLGWLPDTAVTNITTSGTYRIYRFDSKSAALTQPLALRIFRDGVRTYWVGLRQNFSTGSPLANDAYITWGFNLTQQTQLLDLTTPGVGANDAALAIGATFTDAPYGITIKPIARGGTEPAQWLDVAVTVPAAPPNVIAAWGREGVNFFASATGAGITPPTPNEVYVPFGLTGVQAIASGDLHAMALKSDGTVVAWGDNTSGQTDVPAGLANVAAITAGGNISGVVKRDGTIQLWGETMGGVTTPPAGLTGVKQLAIGGRNSVGVYHALALKTDGTIVGWGDNTRNQITIPAAAASDVVAIAASDRLSVALKADGTVVRWGTTFSGQMPFPSGLNGVIAIASSGGAEHALALKADGTVVAWGANSSGQATVPANLTNVVSIATGGSHSLALTANGTVVAWGTNQSRQSTVSDALPQGYMVSGGLRSTLLLTGPHLYLTAQPVAQIVSVGSRVTFNVSAVGVGPLSYQWRKDGVAIAGATGSTLTLSAVAAASAGNYDVIVRDGTSTLTTGRVALAIAAGGQEVARISNLSILTSLASRTDSFRMGFVVGGDGTIGTKRLLIRAAGPSLAALGVPGTLGDPKINLFTGAAPVGENDDWGGQASLSAAMVAVGAFPYSSAASLDAALLADITGRDNTVVVGSAFGGAPSGAVIAEIYDATPSAIFTSAVPRLINVSVLKDIGASLTAGFVIAGPSGSTKKVLIRAVGPGLAVVGVSSGFVPDPKLTLFGASQVKVSENDDWGGTTALTGAFTSVGAFALPSTSKDAALTATLQPGVNYTAVVTGAGGATGLVLVEVYELP